MIPTRALGLVVLVVAGLSASFAGAEDLAAAAAEQNTQYQKAMEQANAALQQGDQNAYQEHTTQAAAYLTEAKRLYDEADAAGKLDRAEKLAYAEVLDTAGDFDLEARVLKALADAAPDDAEVWMRLGRAYLKLGPPREQDAVDALNHAIDLKPEPGIAARARYALGDYYWSIGLYDLAGDAFTRAAQDDGSYVWAKIGVAAWDAANGRVREAVEVVKALDKLPTDEHLQMQRQMSEAMAVFTRSGLSFDDTADNHLAYAQLLFISSRPLDSILAVERAVTVDPKNVAAWNFLGSVSSSVGDAQRARNAFKQSLALNPNQPDIQKGLDSIPAQ